MKIKYRFGLLLTLLALGAMPIPASAQQLREAFRKVSPSVVIVKTKQVDVPTVSEQTLTVIDGLGSGVLISNRLACRRSGDWEYRIRTAKGIRSYW